MVQKFRLALIVGLNALVLTAANGTSSNAPTIRPTPKLSRVEIDVDYSNLLLPHSTQTPSSPNNSESQPRAPSHAKAEERSCAADLVRMRGGLDRHPDVLAEPPLRTRAFCSPR